MIRLGVLNAKWTALRFVMLPVGWSQSNLNRGVTQRQFQLSLSLVKQTVARYYF
jgi:hypothetical protein